jgi:ABC-2 type transport system permease protein
MHGIVAIARKELRSYFNSPIAYVFLVLFLGASLVSFFHWAWARDEASARDLFEALPLLLLFLVPALTMRLWSEERKLGTLEVLLTLPVRDGEVVLGKFLASLFLLGLALALTIGAPITMAALGPLDWGPVAGGYLAAFLLGAAYLAVGLFVSSLTENQILAFLGTLLSCFLLWAVGEEFFTRVLPERGAALAQLLGTGARFRSIGRGVLDLRDLLYYASIVALMLYLNAAALDARKGRALAARVLGGALVFLNLVAANLLARPLALRIDLTEEKLYTISDVTRRTLAELPDRVELYGYFSQDTHEKLAPLVPKIADLAEELRQVSRGKLVVTFLDPRQDEEAEKEAYRRFNLRATPFRLEGKYETGVKSAYFDVVVALGDVHQHLGFEDLIEVDAKGGKVEVRLKNLEYQLVNAIRKLEREFGSLEARLLAAKEPARLTVLLTAPERLPEGAKAARELLEKRKTLVEGAIDDLAKKLHGGLTAEVLDPAGDDPRGRAAAERYGARPLRISRESQETFIMDAVVELSGHAERVDLRDHPDRELTRFELAQSVEAAVRRLLPGAQRKIGLVTPQPELPPQALMEMRRRGQQPPHDDFQRLRELLAKNYTIEDADLSAGKPPADPDLLCVLRPTKLSEKARFALDQYLMLGGKAIVCLDRTEIDMEGSRYGGIKLKEVDSGLDDVLASYGVALRHELLLDDRNFRYPLPVVRDLGGLRLESVEHVPYPWFLLAKGDSLDRSSAAIDKVSQLVLLWPAPLEIDPEKTKGFALTTLIRSSEKGWTTSDLRAADPKTGAGGAKGYLVPEKTAREPVAVALEGPLASAFRDRPPPTGTAQPEHGLEPVPEAPKTTRLVVVGDAAFLSDLGARILGEGYEKSVQFLENLCDWTLADEDMIRIRARGTAERALRPLERAQKMRIELIDYAAPIGLVLLVGIARAIVRKRAKRRVRA